MCRKENIEKAAKKVEAEKKAEEKKKMWVPSSPLPVQP